MTRSNSSAWSLIGIKLYCGQTTVRALDTLHRVHKGAEHCFSAHRATRASLDLGLDRFCFCVDVWATNSEAFPHSFSAPPSPLVALR